MPTWLLSAGAFAASLGFYLLLAGSLSGTELLAGGGTALATAAFVTVAHLRQDRKLLLPRPPLRVAAVAVSSLLTDSVRVGAALFRVTLARAVRSPDAGEGSWQDFRPGGASPEAGGRRALVTVFAGLGPNGFVLDLRPSADPKADHALLLHRLVPAPPLSGKDWPA